MEPLGKKYRNMIAVIEFRNERSAMQAKASLHGSIFQFCKLWVVLACSAVNLANVHDFAPLALTDWEPPAPRGPATKKTLYTLATDELKAAITSNYSLTQESVEELRLVTYKIKALCRKYQFRLLFQVDNDAFSPAFGCHQRN